jgi:opacity protein-like surface antigen
MSIRKAGSSLVITAALLATPIGAALAGDQGFYIGGSVGQGSYELDGSNIEFPEFEFDENDFAWKIIGGYNWDLGRFNLGVEGGWVDFGNPDTSIGDVRANADLNGVQVMGVGAFELGPIDIFGKLGFIVYDLETKLEDIVDDLEEITSESGTDFGYGIGARWNIGSFAIRLEWERYEVSELNSLDMWSLGATYTF